MFRNASGKPLVVIEIGNDWLKIAESRPTARGMCITALKFVRLAEIKGPLQAALAKIFRNMKLTRHSVITYLPRHLTNVRVMELPSTDPKEIDAMVNLQVGKQTPYSKEEIVSAHNIIDTEKEGYIKIMLVIAKRSIVAERVDILEKSGINLDSVAISSEGVYNWFMAAYAEAANEYYLKPIVLVDIDSNYSDFAVVRKGKLAFTRNVFIGANNILENRSEWLDKFVEELARSVERYRIEEKTVSVARIFLSGAAKNIEGLDRILSAKLDIPCEITDPAKGMRIKKNIGILPEEASKFISTSALFGMALKHNDIELDLTPPEARIHKVMDEKRKGLTFMGAIILSIATVFSSVMLADIYNKSIYLSRLKSKVSEIGESADEVRNMRMRINLVEKRLDAKGASINILNEIHKLTPGEVYFTNITIEEKKEVILKGRAQAMSDVFRFVTTLENSSYFMNAKTTYTTTKKEEAGGEYADFEVIAAYRH